MCQDRFSRQILCYILKGNNIIEDPVRDCLTVETRVDDTLSNLDAGSRCENDNDE